jgi:hypothetical protein
MPVIRTFIAKVKPGRMQDAVSHLSTSKGAFLDSGATHFTAYNILTGPHYPGLSIHAVFEDLAAWGAGREKVIQHPLSYSMSGERDHPTDILHALLSESVYEAGNVNVGDIIEQTKVRFHVGFKPHRGRVDDVVRRLSRLADTVHQSGALAASVRRVIAGTEGPRIAIFGYHRGYAEWQATRAAVLESDVWTALSRNQDMSSTPTFRTISTKIDI